MYYEGFVTFRPRPFFPLPTSRYNRITSQAPVGFSLKKSCAGSVRQALFYLCRPAGRRGFQSSFNLGVAHQDDEVLSWKQKISDDFEVLVLLAVSTDRSEAGDSRPLSV